LSRGLASSGNSKNDIGMDASDCKEINVCDIEPAGVKIGKSLKKYPLFALCATNMSHFRLAPARRGECHQCALLWAVCNLRHTLQCRRCRKQTMAEMGGAGASKILVRKQKGHFAVTVEMPFSCVIHTCSTRKIVICR
jgi:hypothetical protein